MRREKNKNIKICSKHSKKINLVAGMIVFSVSASFVGAAGSAIPVYAVEKSVQENDSEKEEVVYIMLDASGTVDSVNVVNIFGKGEITDFGDYSSVKMLTSTNPITQNGDEITFTSDQDRLYYQGTLEDAQIPWKISIEYELDGKKVTPEELAGQSGKLEAHIKITENESCKGSFYDSCALQAAFTLDTEKCENITAEGATLANVGSNKQISYTVLPGKGLDATISADVSDFEMEAATINGVKLNLDVEVNDADLMDQVDEIMDAAKDLDEGADGLLDGMDKLQDGSLDLLDGTNKLYDGILSLSDGAKSLKDGEQTLQKGIVMLNANSSELTNGSATLLSGLQNLQNSLSGVSISADQFSALTLGASQISDAVSQLSSGAASLQGAVSYNAYQGAMAQNGLDLSALSNANLEAANTITGQIGQLQESLSQITSIPGYENTEYAAQAATLQAQIDSLTSVVSLLSANNAAISGTQTYFDSVASGADSLASGLNQLSASTQTYRDDVNTAASQLSGLAGNMESLKSGVNQLVSGSQSLNQGILSYTDAVATIAQKCPELTDGAVALADGSETLLDGAKKLTDGSSDLNDGIESLKDGVNTLKDGTGEFHDKTSDMDVQVKDKIDEMIDSISGSEGELASFVSDKNTNVSSVQFVIKTAAIKKEEPVKEETLEEAPKGFLEKLKDLF